MTIVFYESAYPDDLARVRKWKDIAKKLGVPIIEDAAMVAERKRVELAKAQAEFMSDG